MWNYQLETEQFTEADLLAVTLFENRGDVTNQKGVPACAGGLVPPLGRHEAIHAIE